MSSFLGLFNCVVKKKGVYVTEYNYMSHSTPPTQLMKVSSLTLLKK